MRSSRKARFAATAIIALLAACAAHPSGQQKAPAPAAPPVASQLPRYHCDHDIDFTVRFEEDSAEIDAGPHGTETLQRDAGGVTPQETVFSSTTLKAEFGLGTDGRGAKLHYASPPLEAHCVRE